MKELHRCYWNYHLAC